MLNHMTVHKWLLAARSAEQRVSQGDCGGRAPYLLGHQGGSWASEPALSCALLNQGPQER